MDDESRNEKIDVDKILSDTVKELEVLVSIYQRRGWRGEAARIMETIDQFSPNGSVEKHRAPAPARNENVAKPVKEHGLSVNQTTDLGMRRGNRTGSSSSSNSSGTGN